MWWIFAYHYTANNDAQLSERYIAYYDATFGVLNMRFRTGAFMARHSPYKVVALTSRYKRIWQGLFPAPLFK